MERFIGFPFWFVFFGSAGKKEGEHELCRFERNARENREFRWNRLPPIRRVNDLLYTCAT
jgi:hypothetical protein